MIRFLSGISRAPFIPLSLLCALLGGATAHAGGQAVSLPLLGLALLGAALAHTAVNALNEYADFRSGLDLHTRRTPFSGGSGTLPASPHRQTLALVWALFALLLTAGIGLYFVVLRGWPLAALGGTGLMLVTTYTPWINRFPWFCLAAPGIGFGPVIVAGSSLAVSGSLSPSTVWVSAMMGLLVSGLLLANQQPDVDVDARYGRRHLAIVYGTDFARRVLALTWLLPLPLLGLSVMLGDMPATALLAALPLLLAWANAAALLRWPASEEFPVSLLGRNVAVCLLTPLLLTPLLLAAGRWD